MTDNIMNMLKGFLLSALMLNTGCATTMMFPRELQEDGKLYPIKEDLTLERVINLRVPWGSKGKGEKSYPDTHFGEWDVVGMKRVSKQRERVPEFRQRALLKRREAVLFSRHEVFEFKVTRGDQDFVEAHCDVYGFDRMRGHLHDLGVGEIRCSLSDEVSGEVWDLLLGADGDVLDYTPDPPPGHNEQRIEVRPAGHGSFTGEVRTGERGRVTVEFVKVAANGYSTYYPAGFVLSGEQGVSGAVDIMNAKVAWFQKTDDVRREAMMVGVGAALIFLARRHALPNSFRLRPNIFLDLDL